MNFAENIVTNAMIIKLKREEESLDNIRQIYIECGNQDEKFGALSDIYGSISIGQSVIFCRVSIKIIIYLYAFFTSGKRPGHS